MRIGIPKETKIHEYRVGMVPAGVRELTSLGHSVAIESGAGLGAGFKDDDYQAVGARIVPDAEAVFRENDLIIKVKEPSITECGWLSAGQTLFTYLHLASAPELTRALLASGATAIAYETVTAPDGSLPLLTPMSEVAGRMSIQVGAMCLQNTSGGLGVLLGGVTGVAPAKAIILGGGVAGTNAAEMAMGLGADVTVVDRSLKRLRELSVAFGGRLKTCYSTQADVEALVREADLVVGAVLVVGAKAPKLLSRALVKQMRPGSVLVDISIDQGGCFETSRATTHAEPIFTVDDVVHYCVTNMPGAVARTSTIALTNATLPFICALATHGVQQATAADSHLLQGLNVYQGAVSHPVVAKDLGLDYVPFAA